MIGTVIRHLRDDWDGRVGGETCVIGDDACVIGDDNYYLGK